MIISEINFEIQKDEHIIKERREKVIDEIDKLSKAEAQLKEEINRIEDEINNKTNNINEITIKNKELIKEAVNTNDNINSLHQYICELRENIKIICRIGNSNYSEFLSFPECQIIRIIRYFTFPHWLLSFSNMHLICHHGFIAHFFL